MSLCSINITIGVEKIEKTVEIGKNNRLTGFFGQLYDKLSVYKDQR